MGLSRPKSYIKVRTKRFREKTPSHEGLQLLFLLFLVCVMYSRYLLKLQGKKTKPKDKTRTVSQRSDNTLFVFLRQQKPHHETCIPSSSSSSQSVTKETLQVIHHRKILRYTWWVCCPVSLVLLFPPGSLVCFNLFRHEIQSQSLIPPLSISWTPREGSNRIQQEKRRGRIGLIRIF